ncbi:transporter substrate-binding domain-containing protein [Mycobacterium sp. NBC_00419]|uniref:transporter substrate-binding domain-containing protein n=1 Tax=Mycobacterium sp. NBC_00419 TaxID=2975989 RepID=UPI002E22E96D
MRAIAGVIVMVAAIAGLPALAAPAGAEPRTVTVATHDLAPFVTTHDGVKSGFTIELWEEIAKRQGWSTNFLTVNGVTEQLDAVRTGAADAAASAISITADRVQTFDFSQPTLNAGLQILTHSGASQKSTPGLMDFLKLLFSWSMLVWLGAAFVITVIPAHITWLVERRHEESMVSKSYFPGVLQAFGWGLGTLAAQPDDAPRHWLSRAMGVLWAFVSIIFVAYYTATLTANLTVERFDAQIKSPSDLFGKKVCTVANTTSANFLRDLAVSATGATAIEDCYTGLRKGDFDAVVFDAPVLQYYVQHGGAGTAEMAGPVFKNEDYGIVFRPGSELRKQVDEALLSMREDGTYDMIKTKWFGSDEANAGG